MRRSHLLGLGFMTPAILLTLALFIIPVLLTGVFSFTNMSTSTGITGGAYEINPRSIRLMKDAGLREGLIGDLEENLYKVDADGLALVEKDFGKKLAEEMKGAYDGQTFKDRRELVRAIKDLKSRPRSSRDLNKAADLFQKSILNVRYDSETAFLSGLGNLGITLQDGEQAEVTRFAYTGWIWTTGNFSNMAAMPSTYRAAFNTVLYIAFTLTFNIAFGVFLAVATFYLPSAAASTFRTIWFLPRILPHVLYVILWKWFTWDTGFLSQVLEPFGVTPRNWMMDTEINAWVCVVLINGFVGASLGMILFSSAIKAIPSSMLYASEVDGAYRLQQVRYIILPQLRWPILFTSIYQTLSLLTSFDYIYLATDGGPGSSTTVWALYAFKTALNNYGGNLQYGYGAALALVLVGIGILASVLYLRLFDFKSMNAAPRIEQ
ncbi:carbohydrate ABC transporter permease [Roseibium litorale]|uniref:Sugar ABC transporter permease n=1 Tax=Roseibium litorale TaxID=2803841 RepID=A0ABR9CTD4_9HYPH|nr:sugar ABC transporter permease [Roseibium litorale]MBD8894128.1 sugar ABC transporter permease [Roseibium litorale]